MVITLHVIQAQLSNHLFLKCIRSNNDNNHSTPFKKIIIRGSANRALLSLLATVLTKMIKWMHVTVLLINVIHVHYSYTFLRVDGGMCLRPCYAVTVTHPERGDSLP